MPNCDNDGIRGAVRRLTCAREPENPDLHVNLIFNQYRIRGVLGDLLVNWISEFRRRLLTITQTKLDSFNERNIWCDQPHVKRILRQSARRDIILYGRKSLKGRVKKVDYKCKTGELLPLNKYPRAIGDLTCPGSSALGYYMDWVKECFEIPYRVNGCTASFVKTPDHHKLREVFENLINPVGLYFVFFSDDSCFSYRCSDGVLTANLDISACDGSNFDPVFEVLKEAMSVDSRYATDILDAFKQCNTKCVISSPQKINGKSQKVTLTPIGHVLYSGSVLTTSINNMANTLIFLNIVRQFNPQMSYTKAQMRDIIVTAAFRAGYILKIDECVHHSNIQFLKHSPAVINGEVYPYLNIGTLLRGFGTYCGELPGRKKLGMYKRARLFNSDVVKSWIHAGNTSILRIFQRHYIVSGTLNTHIDMKSINKISDIEIPDEELLLRYGITTVELDELKELIIGADVGYRISCAAVDKIMLKDYGYQL
jgi:hypothetical protein